MKAIVFHRFNAGGIWGLGHLYRNLILMAELKNRNYSCIAIINNNPIAAQMLTDAGFTYSFINEYESAQELLDIVNAMKLKNHCDRCCVFWDRLNSSDDYVQFLITHGVKILTYGDYDKSSFIATEAIISRETQVNGRDVKYSGPSYQLLNPNVSYYAAKEKNIVSAVKLITVHFGGTDPQRILTFAYNVVKDMKNIRFILIDGRSRANAELCKLCEKQEHLQYFVTVNNFSELLYNSDICLLAGGVSMFEASAIGTPMINICQNDDQVKAADIFQKRTDSINLGKATELDGKRLKSEIENLCLDFHRRKTMSRKMKHYVDAYGTSRVAEIVENIILKE